MAATADDPALAPIEGVDLDGYAKAVAAVVKSGTQDPDEAAKAAEAAGIPAGKWQAVSEGWVDRMRTSMDVRTQYGALFQKYR
jgi:hypothetical protein